MFHIFRSLIIFLVSLCCLAFIKAEEKQLVTEMQLTTNDSTFKYSYIYNNDAQIVVETKAYKVSANWLNLTQKEWFPQKGISPSQVERIWKNNAWQNISSIDFQKSDSKIIETHSIFSNTNLIPISKTETEYLNDKKQLTNEFYYQNGWTLSLQTQYFYTGTWLDSTIVSKPNAPAESLKTIYTYNPDSTTKHIVVQKQTTLGEWINYTKSAWYYQNKKIRTIWNFSWYPKTSIWQSRSKLEYYYNVLGQTTEEIYLWWKGGYWERNLRYTYEYYADGLQSKKLISEPLYRDWRNTNTVNFQQSPNSKNLYIESVYGFWGGKTGDKQRAHISFPFNDETIIRDAQTITLTYAPFVETTSPTISDNTLTVKAYPNPSHGVFYVCNFVAANSTWTLTNLNGVILKSSLSNQKTSTIDISEFPNGIYVLKINTLNHVISQKIVKF